MEVLAFRDEDVRSDRFRHLRSECVRSPTLRSHSWLKVAIRIGPIISRRRCGNITHDRAISRSAANRPSHRAMTEETTRFFRTQDGPTGNRSEEHTSELQSLR